MPNRYRRCLWFAVVVLLIACLMGCAPIPCPAEEVNINIVIQIESNGNPNAYNKKSGAIGLMQITPIVLEEYNKRKCHPKLYHILTEDLYLPEVNSRVGSWYLNTRIPQMLKTYEISDTIDNRLWAYNAGIGRVKQGIKPRETRRYIERYHKLAKES